MAEVSIRSLLFFLPFLLKRGCTFQLLVTFLHVDNLLPRRRERLALRLGTGQ